jgi:hypothetical protein
VPLDFSIPSWDPRALLQQVWRFRGFLPLQNNKNQDANGDNQNATDPD